MHRRGAAQSSACHTHPYGSRRWVPESRFTWYVHYRYGPRRTRRFSAASGGNAKVRPWHQVSKPTWLTAFWLWEYMTCAPGDGACPATGAWAWLGAADGPVRHVSSSAGCGQITSTFRHENNREDARDVIATHDVPRPEGIPTPQGRDLPYGVPLSGRFHRTPQTLRLWDIRGERHTRIRGMVRASIHPGDRTHTCQLTWPGACRPPSD